MEQRNHTIQKTVRVWVHGKPEDADFVWIALHGYGQDAASFAKVFEAIQSEKVAIIVPEGPHRFYRKGFSGDVVASWMTKEDRLNDIKDYNNYLNQLLIEYKIDHKKIVVLGFSQGAATACRWVSAESFVPTHLILWAGVVPPDLDNQFGLEVLKSINPILVVGDQDEFLNEEKVNQIKDDLDHKEVPYRLIKFQGKHRLNRALLQQLNEEFQQII